LGHSVGFYTSILAKPVMK